jgi:hypothetical protein
VLYGCSEWYLTLREERRLRVFENRVLRQIFGSKRDANGEWRRLLNEELHSLYSSPNIATVIMSRRLRWAGHVARMEEDRSAFKILMDLKEISINTRNWVDSAPNRDYWRALVNVTLNLRVS